MRFLRILLIISCSVPLSVFGGKAPRLDVKKLLQPETQLAAFQAYRIKSDTKSAEDLKWFNAEDFQMSHQDLNVSWLGGEGRLKRLLVTWTSCKSRDPWADYNQGPTKPTTRILTLQKLQWFELFSAEGVPLMKKPQLFADCLIADLNGDGDPDVIEQREVGKDGEYVVVRPATDDEDSRPVFAVMLNSHPRENVAAQVVWGVQARDENGDGIFDIELGPLKVPDGVEPKVIFRWNAAMKAWEGPEPKPGDHFRVLPNENPSAAAKAIMEAGGLKYSVAAESAADAEIEKLLGNTFFTDALLGSDQHPQVYSPQKLAEYSDDTLLHVFDSAGERDYGRKRLDTVSAVPNFWDLPPKEAALAYANNNRAPQLRSEVLLGVLEVKNEEVPEEGDFTFEDGPSGCYAPGGAFVHHLHCAKDGSFLVYAQLLDRSMPITTDQFQCAFRKMELQHADARHLLQTVWWLTRIRSRVVVDNTSVRGAVSTSDGRATLHVSSNGRHLSINDTRCDCVSIVQRMADHYEPESVIGLVWQLLEREVPERMGSQWREGEKLRDTFPVAPASDAKIAEVKGHVSELLRLYVKGKVSAEIAQVAVETVATLGLRDLSDDVRRVAEALPPLQDYEKQILEIDARLAQVKRKASKLRFLEEDALGQERMRVKYGAKMPDRAIGELREITRVAFKLLKTYDDPVALVKLAKEDKATEYLVLKRLTKLDRTRATELLNWSEEQAPGFKDYKAAVQSELKMEMPESKGGAETALSVLQDVHVSYRERQHALSKLVPADNPNKVANPALNAALLELLHRPTVDISAPRELAWRIALRMGSKAGDALLNYAKTDRSTSAMAALAFLAQQEPEQFQEKLRDLLRKSLKDDPRDADFWAMWLIDAREFREDLARMATGAPEDYQGKQKAADGSVGEFYHLPRHILSIWDEKDPFTQARALAAFGVANANMVNAYPEVAQERFRAEFARIRPSLSPEQMNALGEFITWCEGKAGSQLRHSASEGDIEGAARLLRKALEMSAR